MKLEGRRLVVIPIVVGLLIWIFYDHFVGEATALVVGGAMFMPSKHPPTVRSVVLSTLGCAVGFALVRTWLWK